MWKKGKLFGWNWEIKVYNNSSIYGINNGKISKLCIYKDGAGNIWDRTAVNYDRGWDIVPNKYMPLFIYNYLIKKYN